MDNTAEEIQESLKIVGAYFQDIDTMCLEGYYRVDADRLGNMEEILRCIKLYVLLKNIGQEKNKKDKEIKLVGRKLEVLGYYLKFGYSKKTKDLIIAQLKITDSNLNNVNHDLRKIGVIERYGYNQSNNRVSEDLLDFKGFIVDNKGAYTLIKWN